MTYSIHTRLGHLQRFCPSELAGKLSCLMSPHTAPIIHFMPGNIEISSGLCRACVNGGRSIYVCLSDRETSNAWTIIHSCVVQYVSAWRRQCCQLPDDAVQGGSRTFINTDNFCLLRSLVKWHVTSVAVAAAAQSSEHEFRTRSCRSYRHAPSGTITIGFEGCFTGVVYTVWRDGPGP